MLKRTDIPTVIGPCSPQGDFFSHRRRQTIDKMQVERMKVAPDTVAYADGERHRLIVEFAIPGAPTETVDVKILEDSVYLLAPARDIEYVSALALGRPVKPGKAEATYENGLLQMCRSKILWKMP